MYFSRYMILVYTSSGEYQQAIRNLYDALLLLSAGRAQAFKPNLLTVDNKAFMRALGHRQCNLCQAVRVAAGCAGKMGMALACGAIVG